MALKISDVKYWKQLSYYDGILYCSILDIDGHTDWRMFKNPAELAENMFTDKELWFLDDIYYETAYQGPFVELNYWIIPVRDI